MHGAELERDVRELLEADLRCCILTEPLDESWATDEGLRATLTAVGSTVVVSEIAESSGLNRRWVGRIDSVADALDRHVSNWGMQ